MRIRARKRHTFSQDWTLLRQESPHEDHRPGMEVVSPLALLSAAKTRPGAVPWSAFPQPALQPGSLAGGVHRRLRARTHRPINPSPLDNRARRFVTGGTAFESQPCPLLSGDQGGGLRSRIRANILAPR